MARRPVQAAVKRAALGFILCGAVSLFAHYTWLSPAPAEVGVGETVTVLLASGHSFPEAEGVYLVAGELDRAGSSHYLTWE